MGVPPSPEHSLSKPEIETEPRRTNRWVSFIGTIIVLTILIVVFVTTIKPKDPQIAVTDVQLTNFSAANAAAKFTVSLQHISITNPNKVAFFYDDTSLQLFYFGSQIGFMFIPGSKIEAGETQNMAASFSVLSLPMAAPTGLGIGPVVSNGVNGYRNDPTMEVETRMKMTGRVRVLLVFMARVEAVCSCRVAIDVTDGSLLSFRC